MHVLTCVPTRESIHGLTVASLFRVLASFPGPVSFQTFLAQPVDHARNLCVRHLLSGPWTHLFFVDSDIELSDDTLVRLLNANAPVASGLYPIQLETEGLCLSAAVRNGEHDDTLRFIPSPPLQPREYDAVGLGCCLIRRDVFEAMSEPWFQFEYPGDGTIVGEDVAFFRRLREELGIRPLVIPDLICPHHRTADLGSIWIRTLQGPNTMLDPKPFGAGAPGTAPATTHATAADDLLATPAASVVPLPATGGRGPATIVPGPATTPVPAERDAGAA